MITKENVFEILDNVDKNALHRFSYNIDNTIFNILSNIAYYNDCDKTSKQSMISSLTEDNLKEFEKQLISYAISAQYIDTEYAVLYTYVKYCKYDEKIIKGILLSDIVVATHYNFLSYSEKVMDIIYTPEEKKAMIFLFWENFFEHSKFRFFWESNNIKSDLDKYAFENIDLALNHIYTDPIKIENIEKEIFKKRIDILFSKPEKKYARRVYNKMISESNLNKDSVFVKIGLIFLLKMPSFRKMYIENNLGVKK